MSYVWPAVVSTAVLTGMPVLSGGRVLLAIAVFAGALFSLLLAARLVDRSVAWDAAAQCGVVLACCLTVAVLGRDTVTEEGSLYLHALVPIAAIVALSILFTTVFTRVCFREHTQESQYPSYIKATELFQHRPKPKKATPGTISQGLVLTLIRAPRLVFLPCLAAMLTPRAYLEWVTPPLLIPPLMALILAGLDERLEQILNQLSNRFFQNGALLVSMLVIGLGAARWFGVSYVTTVLDTNTGLAIFLYLCFVYALVWWQDYWIERLAGQQMLRIAGGPEVQDRTVEIPYDYEGQVIEVRVARDSRKIVLHGIGRFLIFRPDTFRRSEAKEPLPFWVKEEIPAFHTWTFSEFFAHLASHARPAGNAHPTPQRIRQRLLQHAVIVRTLTAVALGAGVWFLHRGVQQPSAEATTTNPVNVSLARLMKEHAADRPIILFAASGGGTRAAVFTAAVLEGLSQQAAPTDVLLGSGVSGGGAALAYFAARRNALDWDQYFEAMKKPFIRDVLERASEWRIVAGYRLGKLLAESFERRWRLPPDRDKIGQIKDMGIILNTTIAGHYTDTASGPTALAERATASGAAHRTNLAGGRLVMTNLEIGNMFEGANMGYEPETLPVVIDDGGMRLETAAALNANFPPVFSNAPVDVDGKRRYWVTDGGAADNRGAEMLLYALRHALASDPSLQQRRILVLIADAGAAPGSFSNLDRGLGSAIGAGSQFAMHLTAELRRGMNRVKILYLPMPLMLRESGSFGTHWMLQGEINVAHGGVKVSISGEEAVQILRSLYTRGDCAGLPPADSAGVVCGWIRDRSDDYRRNWAAAKSWLRGGE